MTGVTCQHRLVAARNRVWFVLSLSVWLSTGGVAGADGELSGLRDDVRASPPESPREPPLPPRHSDDDGEPSWEDHGNDLWEGALGRAIVWTFTSPFWAPHMLLDDNLANKSHFLSYPYKRDWDGNMLIENNELFAKWWHVRVRGEYAHDFDRLSRAGGHVMVDTAWRIGFDTSFDRREEDLGSFAEDELWTGDMNLLIRFAQNELIQMRAGVGANWLSDDEDSDWGFNFTYGGDVMPLRPFILSTEIDWGRLGNAGLFHGRATVGVEYRHVEVYTGFDYFDVGGTQIHGWVAGTRLWF